MKFSLVFAACLLSSAAMANTTVYTATLSGGNQNPLNLSSGVGYATVTLDSDAMSMMVDMSFSGLTGTTTASHIHCCTLIGANVPVAVPFGGFPTGVQSGSFSAMIDLSQASSWSAGYITANGGTVASAFSALTAGLNGTQSYINIHTSTSPSGEIRGFLAPVPEPATYGLMALGLVGVAAVARRRRSAATV